MVKLTANMPIQLNMIEVMTSWTLNSALNSPGKTPQTAPPIIASKRQTYHGSWNSIAPMSANAAPTVYCPVAPMLNKPVLNANATERPVMTSGAA